MEKRIIITKRFHKNAFHTYKYLLKEFSAKTAYEFLEHLEERIDFIAKNPDAGKPSLKKKNIRSVIFTPHKRIFYRYANDSIAVLCLFDMRKDPGKNRY